MCGNSPDAYIAYIRPLCVVVFWLTPGHVTIFVYYQRASVAKMDRKRARLAELGRTSYVSKSGMSVLLEEYLAIPADEMPTKLSRATIARACAEVYSISTSYGPVFDKCDVRLKDGEVATIYFLAPIPLLEHLVAECGPFRDHVLGRLRARPSSVAMPWRIALYSDEAMPGNRIKALNERKAQCVYWSLLEFEDLGNENLWLPWGYTRSSIVDKMEAGMSQLMRIAIKSFFSFNGHDLQESGMILHFNVADGDITHLLFCTLAVKIADESALHQVVLNVGAGGNLPCTL